MIDLFFTQDLGQDQSQGLLTTVVNGGKRRKPEYHFENLDHEKND
jgi:hypothetical protein